MVPTYGVSTVITKSVIFKIQNRACRFFLGVPRNTPNAAVQGEMGWKSCLTKQRLEVFRFFVKVNRLPPDRFIHKLFTWSKTRKSSPAYAVFKLSKQLNLYDILISTESLKIVILNVKQRLFQLDEDKWFGDLWRDNNDMGNKLRTYRIFKKDCTSELYLRDIMASTSSYVILASTINSMFSRRMHFIKS